MTKYLDTAICQCENYDADAVRAALLATLEETGGLEWLKPGMKVGIKLNLCMGQKPERASVTHPVMAAELTRILTERGAEVILGDSPGEPYTAAVLNRIYTVTGMNLCEKSGGVLNRNFDSVDIVDPAAAVLTNFSLTSWLLGCDKVISFCKLKSHGMMGMTAAVKNTYGAIPGTKKSETHFRFSKPEDFANLLIDLNQYLKPALYLCDAVEVMEGNGPTQGTPRHMGVLLAGKDPYQLDRVCAALTGIGESEIPYLTAAKKRGLLPEEGAREAAAAAAPYALKDFKRSGATSSWFSPSKEDKLFRRLAKSGLSMLLSSRPQLGEGCIGCGSCERLCPAHAIEIKNDRAVIDRSKCVRCFCCQEFCPMGAMRVHRTAVARLVQR